jgi:hypothetical protein
MLAESIPGLLKSLKIPSLIPVLDEPEGLTLWEQHQDPVERAHQLLLTVQQLTQQRITAVTAFTSKNNSCHS